MTKPQGFGLASSSAALLAQVKAQSPRPSYCEGSSSNVGESISHRSRRSDCRSSRSGTTRGGSSRDSGRRRHSSRLEGGGGGGGGGGGKSTTSRSTKASRSTKSSRSARASSRSGGSAPQPPSSRRLCIDPDGRDAKPAGSGSVYVDDHEDGDSFACSARSKKLEEIKRIAEVEKYAVVARKKATLMTSGNFERPEEDDGGDGVDAISKSNGGNERGSRRSGSSGRNGSSRSKGGGKHPPPIPPRQSRQSRQSRDTDVPHNMTGKNIGRSSAGSFHTSISSMTSMDSYVKKQLCGWESKRLEFMAQKQRRAEQKKEVALEGDYFDDGYNNEDEDETVWVDEGDLDGDRSYFPNSFCSLDSNSPSSMDDSNPATSSSHSSNPRSATSFRKSNSRNSNIHASSKSTSNGSSRTTASRTTATTLIRQREECCIKHPRVRLSDQTDVNVWTCMRYCKDPASGRWHTVKMVCAECLDEDEECHVHDAPCHRGFRRDLRDFRSPQQEGCGQAPSRCEPFDTSYDSSFSTDKGKENNDNDTCSTKSSLYTNSTRSDDQRTHYTRENSCETIGVLPMDGYDQTPLEREAEAQKRRFVRRLAARAHHFPGNTWCEDWIQYMSNTHLVFGIFLHHPLHPVTSRERVVILLGSVAVGLLLSNLIYLWFVHAGLGANDAVLSVGGLDVTKLMIALWTLGSVVHTVFDLSIWHIKACTPCRYGRANHVSDGAVRCGRTAGVTIVLVTLAFATYLVLLRASEDYEDGGEAATDGDDGDGDGESFLRPIISLDRSARHYAFLPGYIVEFVLAVFVYNPLILTVLFSGALGCDGRVPLVGGRPRELQQQRRYAAKRQRYTMPQVLKLGDIEYEADMFEGEQGQKLATNF